MKKRVLITGSSNGIGAEIAKVLSQSGFDVFVTGRNEKVLKEFSKQINAKGFLAIDLLAPNSAEILFNRASEVLGEIDILVNNVGKYYYGKVEETFEQEIDEMFTLNTKVAYKLISLSVPNMKSNKWGRIINIGSISGAVGEANASLYSLTKAALIGMTKALALELAQDNITVNTINPGFVQTNLLENTFDKDFTKEELLDMIPQARFIQPNEIANFVKYLISEEAKGFTGQSINLCAGMSI